MRNSNCHSMEAIIIIECIVQDRKWKSNKVPILIFSTLNSFWVNKWHMNGEIPLITSIKPLPTTILYTLRTRYNAIWGCLIFVGFGRYYVPLKVTYLLLIYIIKFINEKDSLGPVSIH